MFRIIVAEDEPDIRTLYAKVLRKNGYEMRKLAIANISMKKQKGIEKPEG